MLIVKKECCCFASGYNEGMDGCNFTSFSTVFQSYQDDGQVIMKGCVQWNPVYDGKDCLRQGLNQGLLGQ